MTSITEKSGGGYQSLPELMRRQGAQARRYDLCMVFRYKTSKEYKFEETQDELIGNRNLKDPPHHLKNKMQAWKQRREALLKQMKNCGLNLFCYYSRDRDEIFCKVGADLEKMCSTAARMKYKLQLKPEYLSAYAEYRQDFAGRKERENKDRRHYSQMYERHVDGEDDGAADEGAIFTTRDKISIIHHAITSKDKDCAGINIGMLKDRSQDAILLHYFPLHEDKKTSRLAGVEQLAEVDHNE